MRPRRFPSANKVFELAGGNEDNSLWVQLLEVEDGTLGRAPAIRSVWEPSESDRRALARGANVELVVLGTAQPPVVVAVTEERVGR